MYFFLAWCLVFADSTFTVTSQHKTTLSNKSSLQVTLEGGGKAYVLLCIVKMVGTRLDLDRDPLLASSHQTTSFQDIRGELSREIYNLALSSGSWTWGPALSNYWLPCLREFSRACCTVLGHLMNGLRNALLGKAVIMWTPTWKAWTGHPRRILVAVKRCVRPVHSTVCHLTPTFVF